MKKIEGVIIPILTPLHSDETPNYQELRKLVDYVIDGGVDAIFANGTTGEFARFTYEERCQVLKTIVEHTAGRVPVVAGVSDCGTRLVIRNIEYAEAVGADAVVTTMPYYFPTTSHAEQIDFIRSVTAATKLPVMLYNIPSVVGCSLSDEVLDAVCDIENFCGVKDTSGDEAYLNNLLDRYGDKLKVYVGDERLCYAGLHGGASGMVPSLANPFPRVLASAWKAAKDKDWEACKKHTDLVNEMNVLNRFSDSWMSPNIWRKEALQQMGIMKAYFTRPHNKVSQADQQRIAAWIKYYSENYSDPKRSKPREE